MVGEDGLPTEQRGFRCGIYLVVCVCHQNAIKTEMVRALWLFVHFTPAVSLRAGGGYWGQFQSAMGKGQGTPG